MRNSIKKTEDALAALESGLLVAALTAIIFLAFAQVVLRHFGAGLLWAETLLKQLVLWIGFLGAALAARSEKHFAWEVSHLGADNIKPWLRLLANLSAATVCAILLRAACVYVAAEKASGAVLLSVGSVELSSWTAAIGIPVGFALIMIHMLFKTVDAFFDLQK